MRRTPFLFVPLFLAVLAIVQCAPKATLPWNIEIASPTHAKFHPAKKEIRVKERGVVVAFTPLPMTAVRDNRYIGTISVTNTTSQDAQVLWEKVTFSDYYGFFKTFRFGQRVKISVTFPTANSLITPGSTKTYEYSIDSEHLAKAEEYIEFATYTLSIPTKVGTEDVDITVEYTMEEVRKE